MADTLCERLTDKSKEIEELKKNWFSDPCWDIEETEGFEKYKDELLEFRLNCENKWKMERDEEEKEEKKKAEELGLHGLYKMIKALEEIVRELQNNKP